MWDHKALSTCNVSELYLKITRSSVTGMVDDGIPYSSSDSAMTIKINKDCRATFKTLIKINCLSLKV